MNPDSQVDQTEELDDEDLIEETYRNKSRSELMDELTEAAGHVNDDSLWLVVVVARGLGDLARARCGDGK